MIGAPMADRMPPRRAMAVTTLESSAAYRSIRAWPAGLEHQRGHILTAAWHAAPQGIWLTGPAPGADHHRAVRVVSGHNRGFGRKEAAHLLGDCREHRSRRRSVRDERRDPAQSDLLVGDTAQFRTRFGVRHRRGNEFGEGWNPVLGYTWQRFGARARCDHHPPQPPLDEDRAPAAGPHPGAPEGVGDRPGRPGERDGSRRPARAENRDGNALALHRQSHTDCQVPP